MCRQNHDEFESNKHATNLPRLQCDNTACPRSSRCHAASAQRAVWQPVERALGWTTGARSGRESEGPDFQSLGLRTAGSCITSGGGESNNHALKGVYFANAKSNAHIITTQIEHPAIVSPCRFLESLGAAITYLPVDGFGQVDPDDARRAITPHTALISVMHANNEVGTIQPIAEISKIARENGILFHTDAAQSVGKIRGTWGNLVLTCCR